MLGERLSREALVGGDDPGTSTLVVGASTVGAGLYAPSSSCLKTGGVQGQELCGPALTTGETAVPPSLLSTALLLQTHDRVSDAEAKQAEGGLRHTMEGGAGYQWKTGRSPRVRFSCFGRV